MTIGSRPDSYRPQPACANCAHSHELCDLQGEPISFYCLFGAPKFDSEDAADEAIESDIDAWQNRHVLPNGICEHHSEAPVEPCPAVRCPEA